MTTATAQAFAKIAFINAGDSFLLVERRLEPLIISFAHFWICITPQSIHFFS
jgi:hypothetical protein